MILPTFSSWSSSLNLLRWSNLKLFLLVSFKTALRGLKLVATYCWWLIFLKFFMDLPVPYLFIVRSIISGCLFFVYCLALRPSMEPKNSGYFLSYFSEITKLGVLGIITFSMFIAFSALTFLMEVGFLGVVSLIYNTFKDYFPFFLNSDFFSFFASEIFYPLQLIFALIFLTLFFSSFIFSCFFMLDTPTWKTLPHSIHRGIKMAWYNYPIMFLFGTLFFLIINFFSYATFPYMSTFLIWVFREIFLIFSLSLFINYYLKVKHVDYPLFFA